MRGFIFGRDRQTSRPGIQVKGWYDAKHEGNVAEEKANEVMNQYCKMVGDGVSAINGSGLTDGHSHLKYSLVKCWLYGIRPDFH